MKRRNLITITAICLYLVIAAGFFTSCKSDATDKVKCYEQVQIKYPSATIFALPKNDYKYVVVDTCGKVMYVETMDNKTPNVTMEIVIEACR